MDYLNSDEHIRQLLDINAYERKISIVRQLLDGKHYAPMAYPIIVDVIEAVQRLIIREGGEPIFTMENTAPYYYTLPRDRLRCFKNNVFNLSYLAPQSFLEIIRKHKDRILPELDKAWEICHKYSLIRQKMKASQQRQLNRPDHLKASPERNAEILKRYLQGDSFAEIGKAYEMSSTGAQVVVKKLLMRINDKVERELYHEYISTHPFPKEKYPHLYVNLEEGKYPHMLSIPKKDLRGEKEFFFQELDVMLGKQIRLDEIRKKANPKK